MGKTLEAPARACKDGVLPRAWKGLSLIIRGSIGTARVLPGYPQPRYPGALESVLSYGRMYLPFGQHRRVFAYAQAHSIHVGAFLIKHSYFIGGAFFAFFLSYRMTLKSYFKYAYLTIKKVLSGHIQNSLTYLIA